MTPEERAEQIVSRSPSMLPSALEGSIAAAIREAEDAAYERAANEARRGDNGHDPSERIADAICGLKSPAAPG